jgi:hypothetical protein
MTAGAAKKKATQSASGEAAGEKNASAPFYILAAAWVVPGLGHWILGKRRRAVVFGVVIVCAFVTGVLLDGELGTPKPNNPFSWLAAFACLGNGLLYIVRLVWLNGLGDLLAGIPFGLQGGGSPSAAGFAYGNTFLYTAGLMNLLTVLDVSDIARGEKP